MRRTDFRLTPNRVLWLTVAVSLVGHFLIYLAFSGTVPRPTRGEARGLVSVDYIEPVVHARGRALSPPPPARTPKPRPVSAMNDPGPAQPGDAPSASDPAPTRPRAEAGGEPGAINAFVTAVARLIDARKTYPRAALRRELEGRVIVAIILARDGRVVRALIEDASPYPSLDEAALAAVRGVEHFPPLPDGAGETLHLHVPIVFKLVR